MGKCEARGAADTHRPSDAAGLAAPSACSVLQQETAALRRIVVAEGEAAGGVPKCGGFSDVSQEGRGGGCSSRERSGGA